MTTEPDPKIVREIARDFLADDGLTADELDYAVIRRIGRPKADEEFLAWCNAVRADVEKATATTVVMWPDEGRGDAAYEAADAAARLQAWFEDTSGPMVMDEADFDDVETVLADYERVLAENADMRVELEQLRAEREPVREGHGPGVPGAMHLEAFGQTIADAFGHCPYHVGSSATSKTWRDVDVRLILDDDQFHALFPGFKNANHIDAWWSLLCAALSELGRVRTGLPVDFQIQSMTEANEKYSGIRNPLFLIHAQDNHRPTMVGPEREIGGGGDD